MIGHATITRLKQAIQAEQPSPTSRPAWRFYERHHPHSLWHGDFMEKIVLSDSWQRAYHLSLLDDYCLVVGATVAFADQGDGDEEDVQILGS